MDFNQV